MPTGLWKTLWIKQKILKTVTLLQQSLPVWPTKRTEGFDLSNLDEVGSPSLKPKPERALDDEHRGVVTVRSSLEASSNPQALVMDSPRRESEWRYGKRDIEAS